MFVTEIKTEQGFVSALKSSTNQLVVVDFFATWCGPCKELHHILEDMAKKNPSVKFYRLNVDNFNSICSKYSIHKLPTVIFFRRELELERVEGLNGDRLVRALNKHL
jgi:thioredoxin 1